MVLNKRAPIRNRAKRAYEIGRLRLGFRSALPVVPMAGISLLACQQPLMTLITSAILLVLVSGFMWRGEIYGQAVGPGLLAGIAPLILPIVFRLGGHCCVGGACWSTCMLGCVTGGLIAGIVLGLAAAVQQRNRWLFLGLSVTIAVVAGALGCAHIGMAGMLGMVLATFFSSLPAALVAQPSIK